MARIGLIARGDNGGLGIQTWEFFKHIPCSKVLLMDLDELTGFRTYPQRYKGAAHLTLVKSYLNHDIMNDWLQDIDVVFTAETPYDPYLFQIARDRGIKSFLQYNYELLDNLQFPDWPKPDVFLAPSQWHIDDVPDAVYLPVPVNRQLIPFKLRKKARTFIHIEGHRAIHDRNGTEIVEAAIPLLKSKAKIVIKRQNREEVENYWELYDDGDVLLLPRKYGGLSLQMQEALSSGMPVIMTDTDPNSAILPSDWLVEAHHEGSFMAKTMIDIYECTPEDLAAKIDEMYGKDIGYDSHYANSLATGLDWEHLAPEYIKCLQ